MSDWFRREGSSSTPAVPGAPLSAASDMQVRKEKVMAQIRSEVQLSNAQTLINKINEKCYFKCVTKPSASLSGSEETCLTRCMERYMEAFNIVSRAYSARLSREATDKTFEP